MKKFQQIFFLLAMIMALPMVTACNEDDDDQIDYTEYYAWRDLNNEVSNLLLTAQKEDGSDTYFDHTITSLKEPLFCSFVHYFRHADLDSLSRLNPRRDYRPYSTSTLSVHYTLFQTDSVFAHVERLGGWSKALLRNPNGQMDSLFFANAIDNTLKADTIESSQVAFYSNFTPNDVVVGWGDILQNMYIGDNVVVMIPWFLGYGQRGSGKNINPYTNLFFRIELCDITELGATVK